MADDWTDIEVEILVADYFSMLKDELAGVAYNKSEHRERIRPILNNRSDGSVEFKHQNISAVLAKFGIPWIQGYKPRWNYQHILEKIVAEFLRQNLSLENYFKEFSEGDSRYKLGEIKYDDFVDIKPEKQIVNEPVGTYGQPTRVNYIELEQNNKALGTLGEEVVIQYERWRLLSEGKESLADRIEWVAQTRGDWIGYDILSKNNNGTDRYIEVKATKLGKEAPIFFSRNEYEFSVRHTSQYFLYRVFNLGSRPKVFIVNGLYDDFCNFQPVKYKGTF